MKAQGVCFYDDVGDISSAGCYETIEFFNNWYNEGLIEPSLEGKTVAGPKDVGRYKNVRIDVEVGGSGQTNIHMQARGIKKMYYDSASGTFPTAPKKLKESEFVKKGIKKALDLLNRRG